VVVAPLSERMTKPASTGDIAPRDQGSVVGETREEVCRPKPVAEEIRNPGSLRVTLVRGDHAQRARLAWEIPRQHEGAIVFHVVAGEGEEGMFGLEVADLHGTVDVREEPRPAAGKGKFRLGEGEEVQALPVVEIGQAVQGKLFGVRQDAQEPGFRRHRRRGPPAAQTFPRIDDIRKVRGGYLGR